jgi:hypothetical protein
MSFFKIILIWFPIKKNLIFFFEIFGANKKRSIFAALLNETVKGSDKIKGA